MVQGPLLHCAKPHSSSSTLWVTHGQCPVKVNAGWAGIMSEMIYRRGHKISKEIIWSPRGGWTPEIESYVFTVGGWLLWAAAFITLSLSGSSGTGTADSASHRGDNRKRRSSGYFKASWRYTTLTRRSIDPGAGPKMRTIPRSTREKEQRAQVFFYY